MSYHAELIHQQAELAVKMLELDNKEQEMGGHAEDKREEAERAAKAA